jgi:hypothetical protein
VLAAPPCGALFAPPVHASTNAMTATTSAGDGRNDFG